MQQDAPFLLSKFVKEEAAAPSLSIAITLAVLLEP